MLRRVNTLVRKHSFEFQLCLGLRDFVLHPEHYGFADSLALAWHINIKTSNPSVVPQKHLT
jgi:hypothetical protein